MIRPCALGVVVLGLGLGCQPRAPVSPSPPAPTAAPRTSTVEGTVALDGGALRATYRYELDRDDLRDLVLAEPGPIAATGSGNLLGFTAELAVDREVVVSPPVTALAAVEGRGIVAGLADGTLAAVDPRTLALTRIGGVTGAPVWLRRHRDHLIVVAAIGPQRVVHRLAAADPASRAGAPITVPRVRPDDEPSSAWMIDRASRLWYGGTAPAWGYGRGWLGSIDLAAGIAGAPIETPEAIRGFLDRGDAVWAYGGGVALDGRRRRIEEARSVINEVRGGVVRLLWSIPSSPSRTRPPTLSARELGLPVTHMLELDGRIFAVIWSELYEVDAAFATWKRIAAVPSQIRWDRLATAYQPITGVLVRGGAPFALATPRDGLHGIRDGLVEPHPIDDAIDADAVIGATRIGLVAQVGARLYRRAAGRWQRQAIAEPFDPRSPPSLVTAPGRVPYLLADADDATHVMGWGDGGLLVPVAYAHGGILLGEELWTLVAGRLSRWDPTTRRWQQFRHPRWEEPGGFSIGSRLAALVRAGTGWLIHDPEQHGVLLLSRDRPDTPTLARVLPRLRVDDAVAWDDGLVLLATPGGLRLLDPATRRHRPAALPAPRDPIEHLARDRDRRLWLGTKAGLFVVDGGALRAVDIPALAHRAIAELVADPDGGVAVSLRGSGVVHVTLARAKD